MSAGRFDEQGATREGRAFSTILIVLSAVIQALQVLVIAIIMPTVVADIGGQRREPDQVRILSGVFEGRTTGTSIGLLIENVDQRSGDYSKIKDRFRPGHADYTFEHKYGLRDYRGGGRSSARETASRVAAGAILGVEETPASVVVIEGEDRRPHRVPLSVITRANLEVDF